MKQLVLMGVVASILAACARSKAPCKAYDRAESEFHRVFDEHPEPDYAHPAFAPVLGLLEAVPDRCPRAHRARDLARALRAGQARLQADALDRQARHRLRNVAYCQIPNVKKPSEELRYLCFAMGLEKARLRCRERQLTFHPSGSQCICGNDPKVLERECGHVIEQVLAEQ